MGPCSAVGSRSNPSTAHSYSQEATGSRYHASVACDFRATADADVGAVAVDGTARNPDGDTATAEPNYSFADGLDSPVHCTIFGYLIWLKCGVSIRDYGTNYERCEYLVNYNRLIKYMLNAL